MQLRKGCRASKNEKKCSSYDYSLGRCIYGKVKYTCSLVQQPKVGTKEYAQAQAVRAFYM